MVLAPSLFYCFFYDFNVGALGGVWPILRSYVAVPLFGMLYLFFASITQVDKDDKYSGVAYKRHAVIFVGVLQYILVLVICSISWSLNTFPFTNADAVLFTLFVGVNSGAEGFVLDSFVRDAIFPSIYIFVGIIAVQVLFSGILKKRKICLKANIKRFYLIWNGRSLMGSLYNAQKITSIILLFYGVLQAFAIPGIALSIPFRAFFQKPVDSELFRDNYVFPDSIQITAEGEPRNLIVIFMESMETNFAPYTPEINELASSSIDFAPGGESLFGTGWTIAAITGKLCGLPLSIPLSDNEYQGSLPTYLPKAKCLMDVLFEKGYAQTFIQGSSGDFTQKRKFWNVHGNVAVHDIEFYREQNWISQDYEVFWGFEDRKLYDFAKIEIDSLVKKETPFGLYMLTVDTHQPEGYVDDSCKTLFKDVEGAFPKALRCASYQLKNFIVWAKKQSWYDKTVIAVMGDHDMPMLSIKVGVSANDSLKWKNFVINSSKKDYNKKNYSSFDIFPTLLESMGFEVEGRAVGLGVSLFSDKKNLVEKYNGKTLDSLLRLRSFQYDYFLMGRDY